MGGDVGTIKPPWRAIRHFSSTFPEAQHLLKKVIGFELVDLSQVTKSAQADSDSEDQDRTATGKKKNSTASKGYVLRSCLDKKLIAKAAEPFEVKIDNEDVELRVLEFDEDEGGGSGLDGIRMLILAIILAKNRRVSHGVWFNLFSIIFLLYRP